MERVAQGGTVTLTAVYQNGAGDLVDPTIPTVDIIDPDGVSLVVDAVPTRISLGNYSYAYIVPEAGVVGVWRIHWSGTIDGAISSGDDFFQVVTAGDLLVPRTMFATAADLAALLGETFDAARTAQAEAALEVASAAIQGWTRQTIGLVVGDTITIRGTWDDELLLPERPVISVSAITVDGTALTDTDWHLWGSSLVQAGYGNWFGPDAVIEVTYTHGWDPIPDVIRAVTLQIAARSMANPGSLQSESIGTYSATYANDGNGGTVLTIDEQSLLGRFRRRTGTVRIR